jgi:hypothetical protein
MDFAGFVWEGREPNLTHQLPQHELPRPRLTGHRALLLQAPQAGASPLRHQLEQPDVGRIQPRSAMMPWAMSDVVSGFLAFRKAVSTVRVTCPLNA